MIRLNNIVGKIIYTMLVFVLLVTINIMFTEGLSGKVFLSLFFLLVFFCYYTGLRYYFYSQIYDIEDTGEKLVFTSARGKTKYVAKKDVCEVHYLLQSIEIMLIQGNKIIIHKNIVKKERGVPKYKMYLNQENLPDARFFKA